MSVHDVTILSSQEMETTQMSISSCMDKQNVVDTCNGMSFSHKKNVVLHATTWINLEYIVLSERSQTQEATTVCFHV